MKDPIWNAIHHHKEVYKSAVRDFHLSNLRLFITVCELGSIARAADHENIAPSAVSKRIALLEAAVGATLLSRSRQGVQATQAGEAVLEHARSMLFSASRLGTDLAALRGASQGRVQLLATTSALAESLLDDVAAFMGQQEYRDLRLDIEEHMSSDVLRRLRDAGSAAIGICWDHGAAPGLQSIRYRCDRLALAVHPEHPLAGLRSMRVEDSFDYAHVGLPPSAAISAAVQRAAARCGRVPAYKAIVTNVDAVLRVVEANLAVGVLPMEVKAAQRSAVRLIPLRNTWARRQFALYFRDYDTLDPAAKRMARHLQACAENAQLERASA